MKHLLALSASVMMLGIICSTNGWAQQDRRVLVRNQTSYTMTAFKASNVDVRDWQENILGSDVLQPGQQIVVNVDDGTGHCMYDFKAVFDGNHEPVYRYRVDVCKVSSWTITDN